MKNIDKLIVFDGACGLCHAWVRFVIRHDNCRIFKFTSMQSDTGQIVLRHFNLPTDSFETMLYVENDVAYEKSIAALKIIRLLPLPMRLLSCMSIFPRFMRDFVYDRIACNRYKLFGTRDECSLVEGLDKDRFL